MKKIFHKYFYILWEFLFMDAVMREDPLSSVEIYKSENGTIVGIASTNLGSVALLRHPSSRRRMVSDP
jgi:hypothetical protein